MYYWPVITALLSIVIIMWFETLVVISWFGVFGSSSEVIQTAQDIRSVLEGDLNEDGVITSDVTTDRHDEDFSNGTETIHLTPGGAHISAESLRETDSSDLDSDQSAVETLSLMEQLDSIGTLRQRIT